MWFKNLRLYRLTGKIDLAPESLEAKLAGHGFQPCGNIDYSRYGWVPPLGRHGSLYTHHCNGYTLICARKQEKILPSAAINEKVEEKIVELESRQGRNVYRKEKRDIRENVIHTLLPRALTRSSQTYACFAPQQSLLLIDAASATRAEELIENLRATLGELPIVPLTCHGDPAEGMTRWLKHSTPKGFDLDDECVLRNPKDRNNVIRCNRQELESEEIAAHLKSGKRVIQLAINWKNAIRFVLTEDFSLKRIRFADSIHEEAKSETDDAIAQFDQDFAVMTLQLHYLLEELIEAFGGPARDRPTAAPLPE